MCCIEKELGDWKVIEALEDNNSIVVDTRDSSSFLGWCLNAEQKRGHIKGATDFSANWLKYSVKDENVREERLGRALRRKKIAKDKRIILYDINRKDSVVVEQYLLKHGITDISYFNFLNWNGETTYAPGFAEMVPVQWVKEILDGGTPECYVGPEYKIVEVSWGKATKEFLEGHIPGSIHIDSEEYEVPPKWIMPSVKELEKFACANGISAKTTVIIYSMHGQGAVHKLAAVLRYMGVEHVHCLNGDMQSWKEAGYPIEKGMNPKVSIPYFGVSIPQKPDEILSIEQTKAVLNNSKLGQVIDMRTWEAYIGLDSEYDYVPLAGRIPHTLWCHDRYHYFNIDQTMGNYEEMLEHWSRCGIDLQGRPIMLCGSGGW